MTTATRVGRPSLPLCLLAVGLLIIWPLSPGATGGLENEQGCGQARPLPAPSYDSFFGRQGPVEAESPEWRVELAKRELDPECGVQYLFQVKNNQSGAKSQFRICNETDQVDEFDLVKESRALVLGRLAASAPVANVLELPSGKVVDRFMCFLPALSPGHRFLAFIKNFPGHPGPVEITGEYIVYDLTRSADYNRPRLKPGVTSDAGWPVYPPGATNAPGENILPQGSPYHSWTSRGLFWLDDDTLAFTDFFQGENRLVAVKLSRGAMDPEVRTVVLDPSRLVDLDRCKKSLAPSDFERASEEPAGLIQVRQIDPVPGTPGWACLYFVSTPCLRYASLMVKLP